MIVRAHLVLFTMFSVLSINISNTDKNSVYHILSSVHIWIYICIHRWGRAWKTAPEQVTDGARKKHRMWRQSHFPMTGREKFKQLAGSYESQRLWAQGCPRWGVTGALRQESCAPCFPFGTGPTTEKKKCEGWVMRGLEKCSQFLGLCEVTADPVGGQWRLTGWKGCNGPGLGPRR